MLLRSQDSLLSAVQAFITTQEEIYIFSPYVKRESIESLLSLSNKCKALVVRWELSDLISGASDLNVYEYCKDRKIALYRNPRLHLKAYVSEQSCLVTTANISARGIGLPTVNNPNYELGCVVGHLVLADRLFFRKILNESTLMTDSIYRELKSKLPVTTPPSSVPFIEFDFENYRTDNSFLISSLPMTLNPKTLMRICETGEATNDVELNCAMHDLALYDIPLGLQPREFKSKLKNSFFNHPFIVAFLSTLDEQGELYFGRAKAWIQANCTDVPIPRRWEITTNIQILYRWIVDLSEGGYQVDQPNISQRLFIVK